MEYNDGIFQEQFPIVKSFFYHLVCYKELHRTYNDFNLKSVFWTSTIDAHLLQASILWCMVFGTCGSNPTHWKNLCDQDGVIKLKNSFRDGLYKNTELTQEKWDKYWKEMKDFRNRYAAHRELNYSKPVPLFKTAEEVANKENSQTILVLYHKSME